MSECDALHGLEEQEALDLLDLAVTERIEEFGEDAPECVDGYFMYAKCLMLLQHQRLLDAQANASAPVSPGEVIRAGLPKPRAAQHVPQLV